MTDYIKYMLETKRKLDAKMLEILNRKPEFFHAESARKRLALLQANIRDDRKRKRKKHSSHSSS